MRPRLGFLAPQSVAAGQARMLQPDRTTVVPVTHLPEWYWRDAIRVLKLTDLNVRGGLTLATYFTCREGELGDLFHTVYAHPHEPEEWVVLERSKTAKEAMLFHQGLVYEWWAGPPELRPDRPEQPLILPPFPDQPS